MLGFIGVGGMGTGLLNIFKAFPDVQVAAVCDVYEPHRLKAKSLTDGKADALDDFRRVLDRKEIDAVVIATPDHWHAIPTILACQAGKDVYCEKPLSYRIAEGAGDGRRRREGEADHPDGQPDPRGRELPARRGDRPVRHARHDHQDAMSGWPPIVAASAARPTGAPPAGCDYDFWLGPAPKRPFNPNRFTFNWRVFLGLCRRHPQRFLLPYRRPRPLGDGGRRAPRPIVATGGRYALQDNGETPDTLEVVYHYKKGDKGFDLVWSQSDASSHGFEGRKQGIMFQGTDATLVCDYNTYQDLPRERREAESPRADACRARRAIIASSSTAIKTRTPCSVPL